MKVYSDRSTQLYYGIRFHDKNNPNYKEELDFSDRGNDRRANQSKWEMIEIPDEEDLLGFYY